MSLPIAEIASFGLIAFVVAGVMVGLFILAAIWASRYVRVGPNQALVVSGRMRSVVGPDGTPRQIGYRVVKGGGTFVWPMIETVDVLSLELQVVDVNATEVCTADGTAAEVTAAAQAKVDGDDLSIARAVENLLGQGAEGIKRAVTHMIESHLRQVIGGLSAQVCRADRASIAQQVSDSVRADLSKLGISLVSFSIHTMKMQPNVNTGAAT